MVKRSFKDYLSLTLKGVGMGAANVIPGVSGGTIALITNIFEELIDSIKSFNLHAFRLLIKGQFKAFADHVNLSFLIAVFIGVAVSIASLAKLLEYLFDNYPVYVWAFFFGLILASIWFVGRTITRWNVRVIIALIIGTGTAIAISLMNSAAENEGFFYLIICGVVAICSMILPGLSGSFVLILMGNYELVVIESVTQMRLEILIPVLLGAAVGLILFSHLLAWLYKKFKNETISLLTGFILGSLAILWPWKTPEFKYNEAGGILTKSNGEPVISGYHAFIPESFNAEVIVAVLFALFGILAIWAIEKYAGTIRKKNEL